MTPLVAIVRQSNRKSSSVLVVAVFIISAPMKISSPKVRNVKRGVIPSNGMVGDCSFRRTYRVTSKIEPNSIRKPAMMFMNSTTKASIEKTTCSKVSMKECSYKL